MKCFPWFLHRITRLAISVWRRPPNAAKIPIEIAEDETIVRAAFYPQTLDRKGRKGGTAFTLRASIFKSKFGEDEVSVIRRNYTDNQFCKDKAKEIELLAKCKGESKKDFRGFAVITAKLIENSGSKIIDSRSEYAGHAHISHGFVVERNEPARAEVNERLDALKKAAIFIADPFPDKWCWKGASLIEDPSDRQ
ncbi:MAG: hypothetical protein ACLPV8_01240 [Steroidobacteraceae bacterium]